ncbi:PAAR domain-containing protein [Rhizobium sp. BR 317]|uniref:PAAR domain-containing protein n=1 Tax=Rhizobium sp. BR 317 TaxID=3040015 RepID=UPI0039BFC162
MPDDRSGTQAACGRTVPTNDDIVDGSSVANINGQKIARFGDRCSHGGRLVQGVSWITFE